MRKFSINLLKILILLTLGLCLFSITSKVEAKQYLVRQYFVQQGTKAKIYKGANVSFKKDIYSRIDTSAKYDYAQGKYIPKFLSNSGCTVSGKKGEKDLLFNATKVNSSSIGKNVYVMTTPNSGVSTYLIGVYITPKYKLTAKTTEMNVNDTLQLGLTIGGKNTSISSLTTSNKGQEYVKQSSVKFMSSRPDVATVDKNGKITAKASGNTRIIMTRNIKEIRFPKGLGGRNEANSQLTASINIIVNGRTLTKIEVVTKPNKIEYIVGDKFDSTGLTLKATYSDKTTKTINAGFKCSPSTIEKNTKKIMISYGGKTCQATITVKLGDSQEQDQSNTNIQEKINYAALKELKYGDVLELKAGKSWWTYKKHEKLVSQSKKFFTIRGKEKFKILSIDDNWLEVQIEELNKSANKKHFKKGDVLYIYYGSTAANNFTKVN